MALKKCIVLDLDNTLWGGVIGEDGPAIALGITPPGSYFLAFQQALLDHYRRGVLLAINSRNNPEDALAVIRSHPDMLLREEHFAAMRMNWADKAANLRELAEELNIGLDSMVFLDDDPTNRALARALVPEVDTPELPEDPSEYVRFLSALTYFPQDASTNEDAMRGNLYVTERLRKEAEKSYANKEEFLASLGLELTVFRDDASCLPRLAQLSEKTNQFNTDKRPMSEAEIAQAIQDPHQHVYYARLTDTFGDYGVIAFALVEEQESIWHIASLLMSCRVFGRGVEDVFVGAIAQEARAQGARELTIAFSKTLKNVPAAEFVERYFANGKRLLDAAPAMPYWIHLA